MKRLTQQVQALNEGMSLLEQIRSIGATVQSKATVPAPVEAEPADLDIEPTGTDAQVGGGSGASSNSDEPTLNLAGSF